jgi:hypothetical protein
MACFPTLIWHPKLHRNRYPSGKEGTRRYREQAREAWDDYYRELRQARQDASQTAYEKEWNDCFYCPRCGVRNDVMSNTIPGFGLCYECRKRGLSYKKEYRQIRQAYGKSPRQVVQTIEFLLILCGDVEAFLARGAPLTWDWRKEMPPDRRERFARNRAAKAKLPFLEWYGRINRDRRSERKCTSSRRRPSAGCTSLRS